MIIAVIYATNAAAKRKPEKAFFFSGFLFATAKVAYITAMIILHLITLIIIIVEGQSKSWPIVVGALLDNPERMSWVNLDVAQIQKMPY